MGPSVLWAQEIDRSLGLREIKPGYDVYLHGDPALGVSSTFNSGIIVTSEGVVVLDALGSEAIARQAREAISRVTSQSVCFLISSPFHQPFTGGNAVYADAFKIGHEHYREDLLRLLQRPSAEERRKKLPDVTFRDRLTLYLGGKEIQVLHLGRAHTRGDSIVFVPGFSPLYRPSGFENWEPGNRSVSRRADYQKRVEYEFCVL